MSYDIDPISIKDNSLVVTRTIEHCPPKMMLRELVKNAIEAASNDPSGEGYVAIFGSYIAEDPNAPKLCIWNNGRGMTAKQMVEVTELSSTLHKLHTLDDNFGIGAKASALKSNKNGMRYRSCASGKINELWLAYDKTTEVYGRLKRYDENDVSHVVWPVQDEELYVPFDYPEWTEVMLSGNEIGQDTIRCPHGKEENHDWIVSGLYHRFFRIPKNIDIRFLNSTSEERKEEGGGRQPLDVIGKDGDRSFFCMYDRLQNGYYKKYEVVETESKIKIYYIHDPVTAEYAGHYSYNGSICRTFTFAGLIYKDEIYDIRQGNDWRLIAPQFMIPWGYKALSILVELPDDYRAMPESYREALRYKNDVDKQIEVADFAELIRINRPGWFIDIIESFTPKSASSDDIRKQLQVILDTAMLSIISPTKKKDGDLVAVEGNQGTGGKEGPVPSQHEHNNGTKRNPNSGGLNLDAKGKIKSIVEDNKLIAPKPKPLWNEEEIIEKDLIDKAGMYDEVDNVVYVNMRYTAAESIMDYLHKKYASYPDQEVVEEQCKEAATEMMELMVGRAVVFAKVKGQRRYATTWQYKHIDMATTPEALSIVADNWLSEIGGYLQALSKKFIIKEKAA